MANKIITKILRKTERIYNKLLLAPIEVFVFHSVSDTYDPSSCLKQDWSSTAAFQQKILELKQQYTFISLPEATSRLQSENLRRKHYAVLTSDDGFKTVLTVLPFLTEQNIPITLFLNPQYLDGTTIRPDYAPQPQYLTHDDLAQITSPLVTIGMHGYQHLDCAAQTPSDFRQNVAACIDALGSHPRYIPYFAYPWGNHTPSTQQTLRDMRITPVLCDGRSNHRYSDGISRRCIDTTR